jgi:predicted dehydrogenase
METVIVGFGRAGRELHLRALRELEGHRRVVAVDPVVTRPVPQDVCWVPRLDDAFAQLDCPAQAVFHVTVPPAAHVPVCRELLVRGARRLIVEKPMARSVAEADRLVALAERYGARMVPVAVWPHSRASRYLYPRIAGSPVRLTFRQDKPRHRERPAHRSSPWHVELPHQVLLSAYLAGPVASVAEASTWPAGGDGRLPGGARVVLHHVDGSVSELTSDLTSPVRRRWLRVRGPGLDLSVDYPCGTTDSVVRIVERSRVPVVLPDRPLTAFVRAAYAELAGEPDAGVVAMSVHLEAIRVLEEAERVAVRAPARVAV